MAVDHFCLKWNNFESSIVKAFGSLQSTEDLADVTLTCEGVSVKAHKIILSACSPYFRTVFKDNPCPHPIVILKDVLHEDLVAILNFMYHGEVLITQEKLPSFLQTAETLQVSGLVGNLALKDLPIKLPSSPTKNCSKAIKPEYAENVQKQIKGASKLKIKSKTGSSSISTKSTKLDNTSDEISNEEQFESVTVNSIKTEIEEDFHGDHNFNDKVDLYESRLQSSILETALEMKEIQPSILERSLTSHANKSPSIIYPLDPDSQDSILKKSENSENDKRAIKHKHSEISNQQSKPYDLTTEMAPQKIIKLDDDTVKNMEIVVPGDVSVVNVRSFQDVQPHHSSQCGNCPHCGKLYSNQSALKYHVRLVHSDLTNMYCCHLCPESFDYRERYKKHMVEAHSVRN